MDLYWALRNTCRDDLAMDLYDRNLEFQTAAEDKAEGTQFNQKHWHCFIMDP